MYREMILLFQGGDQFTGKLSRYYPFYSCTIDPEPYKIDDLGLQSL